MRKEDLKGYRDICAELERLQGERLKWFSRAERGTRAPSMAPAFGGEHDPLPNIMDKLGKIDALMDRQAELLADARLRIENAVAKLPPVQRRVITLRYIKGLCWDVLARKMNFSSSRVREIHDEALFSMRFTPATKGKRMYTSAKGKKTA
ncbi:MAG: hypothetical protein LBR72_03850 [Oscillospiraceae bacterium]|jgi:DNA-directed RNA polymerase specialized sigma24 family protein|nr:hypothetical protein [Oscillospiraceae bacterium]